MLTAHTQAVLLLTAYFSKASSTGVKPLSNKEWGRFALWLNSKKLKPEDLLSGSLVQSLDGWSDDKITLERIEALLNRGSALALAVEKWSRAGLWIVTRADADYPRKLKTRLGNMAPPLFFGCGNRKLLNQGGIAAVGSRKTSEAELLYSKQLGSKAAGEGLSIVSGGAKGVDEAAMLGALDAEGTAVGILANELLRASTSGKYRKHLLANNLVLISPFHPEAGFNAGNAMQRNKYIYCLSDAAIAVHSGTKGGTWEGVLENIRQQWVPVWVKQTDDPGAGNAALVEKGAKLLSADIEAVDFKALAGDASLVSNGVGSDMFSQSHVMEPTPEVGKAEENLPAPALGVESVTGQSKTGPSLDSQSVEQERGNITDDTDASGLDRSTGDRVDSVATADVSQISLYEHFLLILASEATQSPKTVDELLELTQLYKTQLNAWLKQAEEQSKIEKLKRPVRYQWITTTQEELL
ncbi:DNA-processing protein DprA [Parahaliea aestuarii]|uniref:DNA-processing protein DprA n=1 Tax=Parahaliea aestuarii TaxID=1852021 RepID=A0A5C9A1V6_9GAMM|nr:DNA-processing protein DprA [Parahaliea aestuarii]TXS94758.1 DNA-processing protein DprA [Parahaliea aestuarii]